MKFSCLLTLCFATALMPSAAHAAMELNMQDIYAPAQTQSIQIIKPWTESFAEKTGGSLIVHHFPISAVVEIAEARTAVKSGMLDMGMWAPAMQPKENPYTYVLNIPFIFKSSRHGTALVWNAYETFPEIKKEIDDAGELLAMWVSASYGFSSINAPVVAPSDIKGKRVLILVPGDSKMIEAWGGVPVFVTPSDAYVGLQRGMGEVCYTALPFKKGLRLMEVTKSVTEMPVSHTLMVLSVNRDVWNELSDAEKAMLKEGMGKDFSQRVATSLDGDVLEVKQLYRENKGDIIDLSPEQRKAFVDASTSMTNLTNGYWVKHLADNGVKDAAEWMKKMQALSESTPDPAAQ